MNEFLKFFRWGVHTKYQMALYSAGILFLKAFFDYFCGIYTTDNLILVEIILVCFVVSAVEGFLFPENKELERPSLIKRTLVWAVFANVTLIGSANVLSWFPGRPFWYYVVMIVLLEIFLPSMWMIIHTKLDSRCLNIGLKKYQG